MLVKFFKTVSEYEYFGLKQYLELFSRLCQTLPILYSVHCIIINIIIERSIYLVRFQDMNYWV